MGKLIIFLLIILGIMVVFFKGATKLILALTGLRKINRNPQTNSDNNNRRNSENEDVIYEKGETKVFKGKAGNKQKEQ